MLLVKSVLNILFVCIIPDVLMSFFFFAGGDRDVTETRNVAAGFARSSIQAGGCYGVASLFREGALTYLLW